MKLHKMFLLATLPILVVTGGALTVAEFWQAPVAIAQSTSTDPAATPSQRPHHGERGLRLPSELNLTTEQTQQIEALEAQSQTATTELREQMQQAHEQLQTLMASDASTAELRQQHQQVQALHQQLADQRFETMLKVREILTPEQRAQMAELTSQYGPHGRHSSHAPQGSQPR